MRQKHFIKNEIISDVLFNSVASMLRVGDSVAFCYTIFGSGK